MDQHTAAPSRSGPVDMAFMVAQLTWASWETILLRTALMAAGTCSAAEYRRMVTEKAEAMQSSAAAALSGQGHAAQLSPFLRSAQANARRLRRR